MSKPDVIRARKDEDYYFSLSEEHPRHLQAIRLHLSGSRL